ncbi:hypothetical protein Pelo_9686 [Pelomyxa schiedti]|nr:hypothetical protein Pelo_9686 [Pelomyxa schiedti]
MWAMLSGTMKEIVGVGATAGMGDVGRRHFDLMACACAQQIADSLISEFEVMNDMVPVCVGPFIGRLDSVEPLNVHFEEVDVGSKLQAFVRSI